MVHAEFPVPLPAAQGVPTVPVAGPETDDGRKALSLAAQAGLEVPVAEDEGPGDDNGDEEELYAAFAARSAVP